MTDPTPTGPPIDPTPTAADPLRTLPVAPAPVRGKPPEIPGYELLGELGRGGMGVVYRARQVELNRLVALKMVRGDDDALDARFLIEAEAVARVRHPNVVQIFHTGRHAGQLFFVMELVPGGSLADRLKDGGPLPPATAAAHAAAVARGVAAAHAAGIVHRDLKPANVLLGDAADAVPKVTDFGLAKKLDADETRTATGVILGTPGYMSPEQARGDARGIGPAADVYGLGAVLYSLVTGRPPFQGFGPADIVRQVIDAEPLSLRQLQPGTPRDLETIALKCLAKDPHRRYTSALAVAADLDRYLAGKPILARPAGVIERGWKWANRNRVLASSSAAAAVSLAAGTAVSVVLAVRATDAERQAKAQLALTREAEARAVEGERTEKLARTEAERQARTAAAVKQFLQSVLGDASVYRTTAGRPVTATQTVKEAMDFAAKSVAGRFPDEPLVEAEVRTTIGTAYMQHTENAAADAQFTRAIELFDAAGPAARPRYLHARLLLGKTYIDRGFFPKAQRLLVPTYDEIAAAGDPVLTADAAYQLGHLYMAWGVNFDKAGGYLRAAGAAYAAAFGPADPHTLGAAAALGHWHYHNREFDAAEPLLKAAAAGRRAALGDTHPHTWESVAHLGELLASRGDLAAAEPYFERALAGRRVALGDSNPHTLRNAAALGRLYLARGKPAAAVRLLDEAYDGLFGTLGPRHPHTLESLDGLAEALLADAQFERAEGVVRTLLKEMEAVNHLPVTLFQLRSDLGCALAKQKKWAEAEKLLLGAYEGLIADPDAKGGHVEPDNGAGRTAGRLAEMYESRGDAAAAAVWRKKIPRPTAPAPRRGDD